MISLIAIGVCLSLVLIFWGHRKLDRLAEKSSQQASDFKHAEGVEEEVSRATEGYTKRLRQLEAEKEELPNIDLWTISSNPNWQRNLIAGAEKLRSYIVDAYGQNTPDTYNVEQISQTIPIDSAPHPC